MLLAICIPTYQRRELLRENLSILCQELASVDRANYVVRVFDNDESLTEVECDEYRSLINFDYVRHDENIGSDANIARCYSQEEAEYVLVLGDDDFVLPGRIERVLKTLATRRVDVLFLKASGFERHYASEVPRLKEDTCWFVTPADFLRYTGAGAMAISCIVVRRSAYRARPPATYIGTNLVQLGVLLDAMENARVYAATKEYVISGKRNNTGGYDPERIFVSNIRVVYRQWTRSPAVRQSEEVLFNEMLKRFYPQRLFQARQALGITAEKRKVYHREFSNRIAYWLMVVPILWCPRLFMIPVGLLIVAVSKTLNRDVRRSVLFLFTRILGVFRSIRS